MTLSTDLFLRFSSIAASGMQDHLSREEAIIAFNACEHNQHAASNNNQQHNNSSSRAPRNRLEQQQQQQLAHGLPCIKLERDTLDATERWQSNTSAGNEPVLNSTRLLLQGSDDPLISHGASNDAHDEDQDYAFKCLLARKTEEQLQSSVQNGACSTLTKQQLKANLMNGRKQQLQQQQQRQMASSEPTISSTSTRQSKTKRRSNASGAIKLRFHHQALPAEYAAHYEATQGRHVPAPRAAAPAVPPAAAPKTAPAPQNHENVRSWLRKIAEIQRSAERQQQAQESGREVKQPSRPVTVAPATTTTQPEPLAAEPIASTKRAAIKYADLPYMGEITLDNYKPRRGRKPKKADICHLIYKNYGTIIPPNAGHETKPPAAPQIATPSQRVVVPYASAALHSNLPEEPLNLCMRDQSSDRYSISSSESDKPSTVTTTTPTTECGSCSHRTTPLTEEHLNMRPIPLAEEEKPHIAAKMLLHPMGLYYQQLMETCRLGLPVETIEKDNQLALKIPIPSGFFASSSGSSSAVPKREPLLEQPLDTGAAAIVTQKRKRSAIFIPPMPSDHSSSPSTEVSICKFKFTGGAKPTLQEKKMLSVDAEGNYRYYNGTGDRTMRGYEFISREQQQLLQQQQLPQQQQQQQPSHEKLYIDIPPPSTDLSLELLHIPSESPTSSLLMSNSLVPVAPQSPSSYFNSGSPMRLSTPHPEECHKKLEPAVELTPAAAMSSPQPASTSKRRSSRRARQREKLEKTFKEKGFLIQTQQLQSAEGATYCKFRQLKKFTRYLFRNWKDHIPESDLAKHQSARDSSDSTIENMLAGQIGLGVKNLSTN